MDLLTQLRAERARRESQSLTSLPLGEWIPRVTPAFSHPRHLGPLLALFDRAEREPVRACLSVPPRHSKTETTLHGIARLLLRHPDWAVGYVSYSADVARSKSRQIRDYALRAGLELRRDSAALHEWRTPQGGGVLATGVGGPLTGHGVRLLVIDDPVKNRQEGDSPTIRERIHQWFTSTAMTRLEPGASALVVHTRWHRDDLIGRLERDTETPWEVTALPALDAQGRALWPERWPVEELLRRRAEVGEYDWSALFQQHPTVRKGRIYSAFDRASHVVPHEEIRRRFRLDSGWQFRRIVVGVDWGYSDPSAWIVVGQTGTGDLYVLDELYERQVLVDERGWLGRARTLRAEYRPERFVADPSESGYIAALRVALNGRPVVEQADNAISEGIRRVQVKLQPAPGAQGKRPSLIVSDRCANLIRELETYSYRIGPDGPTDTPQDGNDHAADALRYAVAALTR